MANKVLLQNALEGVKTKFLTVLKDHSLKYQELHQLITKHEDVSRELLEELCYISHKISGSAKTFGFPKIGSIADEIEYVIESVIEGEVDRGNAFKNLDHKVGALLEEYHNIIETTSNSDDVESDEAEETFVKSQSRCKILVIDDDPLIGELLKKCLKGINIWVDFITDSRKSMDVISEYAPHMVILDVNMPALNGFEVLKMIKANQETKKIPVLMLTKRAKDIDQVQGFSSGADDYVTKPFDLDILIVSILEVIQRNFPDGVN